MTFVDILLIIVFLITVGLGFFKGTIKFVISIVAFYASIVLASLYFRFLAIFFVKRNTSEPVANAISFFLILFLCFVIFLIAGLYTFRYLKMPGRLDYIDRILGMVLGFGMAILAIGIISMLLHYTFVQHNPAASASFPLANSFQSSVRGSVLRPLLIGRILPVLYNLVAPFLPESALAFFTP